MSRVSPVIRFESDEAKKVSLGVPTLPSGTMLESGIVVSSCRRHAE
jgi:hypothetical protein